MLNENLLISDALIVQDNYILIEIIRCHILKLNYKEMVILLNYLLLFLQFFVELFLLFIILLKSVIRRDWSLH